MQVASLSSPFQANLFPATANSNSPPKNEYQFHQCCAIQHPQEGMWQRFSNFFRKQDPNSLYSKILKISTGKCTFPWEEQKGLFLSALESKKFLSMQHHLKKSVKALSPELTQELMSYMIRHSFEINKPELIDRCMNLLSFKQLEETVTKHLDVNLHDIKASAKKLLEFSKTVQKHQLDSISDQVHGEVKKQLPLIIRFLSNFANSISAAISLLASGKNPVTYYETKYMLDIYWELLAIPFFFFKLLECYFVSTVTCLLIMAGTLFVGAAILYIYFKWFQPRPEDLRYCVNLTREAKMQNLPSVVGRDDELDALIHNLISNGKADCHHPILVGNSGVGKTTLINGLVQRIIKGDVPPQLRKMNVFKTTAAKLKSPGFVIKTPLEEMMDDIGPHHDNIILFIDEFHSAWENGEFLGESLQPYLDMSKGSLRYCIMATTPDKFAKIPKNRRYIRTEIEETDEDATIKILRNMTLQEAPEIRTGGYPDDQDPFKRIYNSKLPDRAQPDKSKLILSQVIAQIKNDQINKDKPKRHLLKAERDKLAMELSNMNWDGPFLTSPKANELLTKIRSLDEQLSDIDKSIADKTENLKRYHELKKQKLTNERKMIAISHHILNGSKRKKDNEELQKLFLFTQYFVNTNLDTFLESLIQKNDFNFDLKPEIIDAVVSRETNRNQQ